MAITNLLCFAFSSGSGRTRSHSPSSSSEEEEESLSLSSSAGVDEDERGRNRFLGAVSCLPLGATGDALSTNSASALVLAILSAASWAKGFAFDA